MRTLMMTGAPSLSGYGAFALPAPAWSEPVARMFAPGAPCTRHAGTTTRPVDGARLRTVAVDLIETDLPVIGRMRASASEP